MRTIKLQLALSALVVGLSLATPSLADHAWGPYHWARTTSTFILKHGDNMTTSEWKSYLKQASVDWNTGGTPVVTNVVSGSSGKNCNMVAGTTQVCNGKYGFNGWLGLASINITGGEHITQGSAKMNDSYFNSSYYNNPNEKLHVVCQEIAHTFGLGHQSEDGSSQNSCMDYFSNTGANAGSTLSTKPNQHDFDQLFSIYDHVDGFSTVDTTGDTSTPPKPGRGKKLGVGVGVDIDHNDPGSWGRLVSQTANGRGSIYERKNTDGSLTVTHVYWTEEAASGCRSCDHRYQRFQEQH